MAGTGSVENRGKGSWRLTVSLGVGEDGKYIKERRTVKAKNKTEAEKMLAAFVAELDAGEYTKPSTAKFGPFVEEWRQLHAKKHLSPKTFETYNYILDTHILPAFKNKKLQDIKPIHISKYLDSLESSRKDGKEGGLSSATIYKHYAVLRSIFKYAAEELKILKSNPAASIKKPKVKNEKFDVYTEKEVDELFKLLENELGHYRLMAKLAIMGGLRRGEVLGIQSQYIDYDKNSIDIQYSLSYTKNNGYELKPPKNGETRKVILPPFVMKELKDFHHIKKRERLEAAELWNPMFKDIIFTTSETKEDGTTVFGKPFYPGSVSLWWRRFLKRTKFKHIRFHDLRHTAATLLINAGVHAKNISARLGHSDIQITMNTYGHHLEEADTRSADILESKFGKSNT